MIRSIINRPTSTCILILSFSAGIARAESDAEFTSLFDGKTLNGWHATPGGKWEVKDGMIVGTSPQSEGRHGLLVSDKEYSNFTVRFKFRVIQGNSGFYFRSQTVEESVGVHGFQAEVDNSASVSGIYETGGRAWVAQPDPEVTKRIYKPGEWNEMSITAVGRGVTVCLNGTKTVELKDDPGRSKGILALQLHGGMDMEVMFKEIEIRPESSNTQAVASDGFQAMFNGTDLTGWKTTGNWKVEEGGIVTLYPRPGEEGWQRYDAYLTTERKYKDFVLDLEFKIGAGGNSGVFLRVGDPLSQVDTGFEVQILDTHGVEKPTNHDCGGVISAMAPSKNMAKPAGQWNRYVITCQGSTVKVVFNGEQVIDLDLSRVRPEESSAGGLHRISGRSQTRLVPQRADQGVEVGCELTDLLRSPRCVRKRWTRRMLRARRSVLPFGHNPGLWHRVFAVGERQQRGSGIHREFVHVRGKLMIEV